MPGNCDATGHEGSWFPVSREFGRSTAATINVHTSQLSTIDHCTSECHEKREAMERAVLSKGGLWS